MSELSCEELVELVTEFLEGTLDEETEERVTEHLSQCDGCGRYLEQFRATVDALGRLPAPGELPPETRNSLLEAFRRNRA